MYYGLDAFDDFTGLGAAPSDRCAKIQSKIDAIKAKQQVGGTVSQMSAWDKQLAAQTKQLEKCAASAGAASDTTVSETGASSSSLFSAAKDKLSKISGENLAKAAALVGTGKLSPELEAVVRQALGIPGEVAVKETSEGRRAGAESEESSDELIWGIPKKIVYVIGGVVGFGILATLLLQRRSGSGGVRSSPAAPTMTSFPLLPVKASSAGGAK